MKWTIEPATEADVPSLVQLLIEATEVISKLCPPPFGSALRAPADIPQEAAYMERAISDPESAVMVGRIESGVAAFGLATVDYRGDDIVPSPHLTISQLVVRSDAQRKGIGAALLAALEQWAMDRGLAAVDLSVFEGNAAATGLFRKMGYLALEHRMGKVL